MTVLTELSQVPRPWLYWQSYPRFHGRDCTDRIIPGSTAMTVLTELSQVPLPWLYWQSYPRFHGHDYWQKYPRSYGRYVVSKVVQLLPVSIPVCGLHTLRSAFRSVTESELSSCLHHKWRHSVWVEHHVHLIDIIQTVNRGVWRHCVHQSCLDRDSGVPKGCGWDALTFLSVT